MSDQSTDTTELEPLVNQDEQALGVGEHDDASRLAGQAREHPATTRSQKARASLVLAAAAARLPRPRPRAPAGSHAGAPHRSNARRVAALRDP